MYNVISVVFTTNKLNAYEISKKRHYAYVCDEKVSVGDLITGHCGDHIYDTPMQVIEVKQASSRSVYNINGEKVALKNLNVDSINGKPIVEEDEEKNTFNNNFLNNKEMKKANNMFAGIADKYKSQWIPEREDGVKMSMDGTMCIAIGDEYIGMKSDGTLTSYPREVLIDIPVYSINKPSTQVQIGDVIKNGPKSYGKVMMKNPDGSLKILSYTGYTHNKQEVQDFLLGQAMTRVLVNVFNFDAGGFNPLIFALSDETSDFDIKDMLMLQMMTGNNNVFGGNAGGMNPLMLMALTGKGEGEGNDMLNLMVMSQMMGGQNPLNNIVPQPVAPAQAAPQGFDVNSFVDNLKKNPDLAKQIKDALNNE
jgi:hypothetical protein